MAKDNLTRHVFSMFGHYLEGHEISFFSDSLGLSGDSLLACKKAMHCDAIAMSPTASNQNSAAM